MMLILIQMSMSLSVNQYFLAWLEWQSYYEVYGGAVESQSYVGAGFEQRNVFKRWRKTGRDGDDWMSDGSELQRRDTATGNVCPPTEDHLLS